MSIFELTLMYFFPISLLAIVSTIYDKFISKRKGARRISESTLFTIAVVGGALAMYVTMRLIRHKTQQQKFMVGLPIVILIHGVLLFILF